jgi:K+ transporter
VGDHALVFTVLGLIAISGAEAMFADLGHFSKLSLRVHLIFFNMDMSFVIEVFESIFTMTFFYCFVMAAWIHNYCVSLLSSGLHG